VATVLQAGRRAASIYFFYHLTGINLFLYSIWTALIKWEFRLLESLPVAKNAIVLYVNIIMLYACHGICNHGLLYISKYLCDSLGGLVVIVLKIQ